MWPGVTYIECGTVITRSIFSKNIHERHPIARPLGRGMGCLLLVQPMLDNLPQFLQWYIQYVDMLDRVITALDYIPARSASCAMLSCGYKWDPSPGWTMWLRIWGSQRTKPVRVCRTTEGTSLRIPLFGIARLPTGEYNDVTIWTPFSYHWPFVRGIHQWRVDFQHKWPVVKIFVTSLNKFLRKQPGGQWNEMP